MKISVLIAARNEAPTILGCLQAIEALDYPKNNLQVLIGDDDSTDKTATLVQNFIKNKSHYQLVSIKNSVANLQGKANVLAQLAHLATGEWLFFTDADTAVPPSWIVAMLSAKSKNVAVVTGVTTIQTGGIFGVLQGIEWLYYLSLIRLLSLFKIPITALGNNMAVSSEAYFKNGGYEKIGFSLTEDYALFDAITKSGFEFRQWFDARVLATTRPIPTFKELMQQRKRWMHGALSLPFQHQIGTWSNALFLPILLIVSVFSIKSSLALAAVHYIFISAWTAGALTWLRQQKYFWILPIFWFYHIFLNFAMLINFFWGKKTIWKGRVYE
jgi:1,2-diacylglycerol 3-beta-glucosyltransferase